MTRFVVRRLLLAVVVIFGVTLITFVLARVLPQNVAQVWAGFQGFRASEDTVRIVEEQYNLNEPLYVQYAYYLRDLVTLNWGTSPITTRPVADDIKEYLPNTIELTMAAMLIAVVVAVPLGIVSATHRNSIGDHLARLLALFGVSAPGFWVAMVLQLLFYYRLGWVEDPGGRLSNAVLRAHPVETVTGFLLVDTVLTRNWVAFRDALEHLILPSITLALPLVALISRMVRSSMLEVLRQDYVRTARAKGLTERLVVGRHAFRNAIIPTVTVIALSFGWLLTGAVVTEVVFYWPGIGQYAVGAVMSFDFPAIIAFTAISAAIFVLVNLAADVVYAYLDPRVRYD
jgi:ABC-type dipeptide/oligopeptide/nickel transport system permease component